MAWESYIESYSTGFGTLKIRDIETVADILPRDDGAHVYWIDCAKFSCRSFTTWFYMLSSLALTPVDNVIIIGRWWGVDNRNIFIAVYRFSERKTLPSHPAETFCRAASPRRFYDWNILNVLWRKI